jgi:hypothetical protein
MTTKQYRTAMGKTVDMGALMLQNENARAVGNMAVNARGDRLDSHNRVIDRKTKQAQRQYQKQSNVSGETLAGQSIKKPKAPTVPADTYTDLPDDNDIVRDDTEVQSEVPELQGGLAAAIAKAKTVQQTKLTPPNQAAKSAGGVRKI